MANLHVREIAEWYLAYVNPISVLFLIVAFGGVWWKVGIGSKPADIKKKLHQILMASGGFAVLPTGVALLICAFDPSLLPQVQGQFLQVGYAGLVTIFNSVMGLSEIS